jgi:chaperone LolA
MFHNLKLLAASIWFAMLAISQAGADQHTDAITTLTVYLAQLDSYQAGFIQNVYGEGGRQLESSTGIVYLQRPGRFHWMYQSPYSQYLISNGVTLWIYDEDLQQLTVNNLQDNVKHTPASILSGDVDISEEYDVSWSVNSLEGEWIELVSKDVELEFNSMQLGFYDGELIGMILNDNLGNSTQIEFRDVQRDMSLDMELFEFEAPDKVDVIDMREHGE